MKKRKKKKEGDANGLLRELRGMCGMECVDVLVSYTVCFTR